MDGLTIGVLVFGILLLVVWLPILIVCQAGQRILVGVWIGLSPGPGQNLKFKCVEQVFLTIFVQLSK